MNRTTLATLVLFALVLDSVGCTKTVITKIARHEVGGPPVAQAAPTSGTYKVKWAAESRKLQTLDGTMCLIGKGDRVGFERSEDGQLIAFAGKERIPLARLPEEARYCVWYAREERQTQFGKEVGKALNTTGQVAEVAAGAALLTGLVALEAWSSSQDADDAWCDSDNSRHHRHHGHDHHGHDHHHHDKPPPTSQPAHR